MRVIWTPEAEHDRAEVWNYISNDKPVCGCDKGAADSHHLIRGRFVGGAPRPDYAPRRMDDHRYSQLSNRREGAAPTEKSTTSGKH